MRIAISMVVLLLLSAGAPSISHATDDSEIERVKQVLSSYKTALERLDLAGVEGLFAANNEVVESGKVEGDYAAYRDNHIGPELGHFESFEFSDYAVRVRMAGPVALATETYRYTIVLKGKREPIVRQAVATSVLAQSDGEWKIVSMHSSSRTPKAPSGTAPRH